MTPTSQPVLTRHISLDFKTPGFPFEIEPITSKKKPLEISPRPDESPQIKIKKSLFEKIQTENQKEHDILVTTRIQSKQSKHRMASQYKFRLLDMQEEVNEKAEKISKLQQTLQEKENYIYFLEGHLQTTSLDNQYEIDKKAKEILELQRTLQEKKSHINRLEKKVKTPTLSILDTKIVSPQQAEPLTIRQYIEEKRITINTLQKQLNEARKNNSILQRLVQENHQMFFSLSQQLQEKHQMVLHLNQQLQYHLNLNAINPIPPRQRHVRFQEQTSKMM